MPSFLLRDGRHYVSYITGPTHTLLGVKFTDQPCQPNMVKHKAVSGAPHEQLDESRIAMAVEEVLIELRQNGAPVFAAEIAYVEDDSPRYTAFKIAATLLVRQYLAKLPFQEVGSQ